MDAWSRVLGYRADGWSGSVVLGSVEGEEYEVRLPVLGKHQALNVAAAMAVAVRKGVSVSDAAKGIEKVPPLGMRMEVRQVGGVTVLLDTYNASPDSTVAALKTLEDRSGEGSTVGGFGGNEGVGRLYGGGAPSCRQGVGRFFGRSGVVGG